jgi:hypothetical protein
MFFSAKKNIEAAENTMTGFADMKKTFRVCSESGERFC